MDQRLDAPARPAVRQLDDRAALNEALVVAGEMPRYLRDSALRTLPSDGQEALTLTAGDAALESTIANTDRADAAEPAREARDARAVTRQQATPLDTAAPASSEAEGTNTSDERSETDGGPQDRAADETAIEDPAVQDEETGHSGAQVAAAGTSAEDEPSATRYTRAPQAAPRQNAAAGDTPAVAPVSRTRIERGSATLPRDALYLPPLGAAFRAPMQIRVEPDDKTDTLGPETADYRDVFASAAKAAQQLFSQIKGESESQANAFRTIAQRQHARREQGLRTALDDLTGGTEDKISALDSGVRRAKARLIGIARTAEARIEDATRTAKDTFGAQAATMQNDTGTARTDGARLVEYAAGKSGEIDTAGETGTTALDGLAAEPAPFFPLLPGRGADAALTNAQAEVLLAVIPSVAQRESGDLEKDRAAQACRMLNAALKLQNDLIAILQPFDDYITVFTTTAPNDADAKKTNALRRLSASVDDYKAKMDEAQKRTRSGLIEQHNSQRAALIDAAETAAEGEADGLSSRAEGAMGAFGALAMAQGATITAIHDGFRQHRGKPAEEFAFIVKLTSERTVETARAMVADRLTAMDRRNGKTDRDADRWTRSGTDRLAKNVDMLLATMGEQVGETIESLMTQASGTRENYLAMADPIRALLETYAGPTAERYEAMMTGLTTGLERAGAEITTAFEGPQQSGSAESSADQQSSFGQAPPCTVPQAPHGNEVAQAFVTRATAFGTAVTAQEPISGRITTEESSVANNVTQKVTGLHTEFQNFDVNAETVLALLRDLSPRRGWAVETMYNDSYPGDGLIEDIAWNLNIGDALSGVDTRVYNIQAAWAYLRGNTVAGARNELLSATEWWNDSKRIDTVMENIPPAQMDAFRDMMQTDTEFQEGFVGDLDVLDARVFELLRTEEVGAARSLRLEEDLRQIQEQHGDQRADLQADAIRRAHDGAGTSRLEGARGAEGIADVRTDDERKTAQDAAWGEVLTDFDRRHPIPEDERATNARPGDALIAFANREIDYEVYVPDEYGDGGHYETRTDSVRSEQQRLIENLVRYRTDSPEVRAAQLQVERTRTGGAKHERVRQALDDPRLNVALANPLDTAAQNRAAADETKAREDQTRMFRLLDQYNSGTSAPDESRSVTDIREELGRDFAQAAPQDEARANYLQSMAEHDLHSQQVTRAAFSFAHDHLGTREDVWRQQISGMSREQIDTFVTDYDSRHPGAGVYETLGIHGHRGDWWAEYSGSAAGDIQTLMMGKPRNPRERFEVAAMRARIAEEDVGDASELVADEQLQRMRQERAALLDVAGVQEEDFDELGRLINPADGRPVGRFNETGAFEPVDGQNHWDLAVAMTRSGGAIKSFHTRSDAVADAITTTLVVAAAVTSTALTGGTAASIWIPVLTTMAAGVVAMGVNEAIKGGRYGYEQGLTDFATTVAQAATAGVGAAAGAYLRGGAQTVKSLSGALSMSDEALGIATKNMGFVDDLLVGGLTGGLGGATGGLLNEQAFDSGKYGEEFGHALMRGILTGIIGGGIMHGAGKVAGSSRTVGNRQVGRFSDPGQVAIRGLGSGVSGAASTAAELGYERHRGKYRGSLHDALNRVRDAGLKNAAQGSLEAGIEKSRTADRLSGYVADPGRRWNGGRRRPGGEAETDTAPPRTAAADLDTGEAMDPGLRQAMEIASQGTRPNEAMAEPGPPRAQAMPDLPPRPRSMDDDITQVFRRPPEDEVTQIIPRPEDEVTQIIPRPEDEVTQKFLRTAEDEITQEIDADQIIEAIVLPPDADQAVTERSIKAIDPDEEITQIRRRPEDVQAEDDTEITQRIDMKDLMDAEMRKRSAVVDGPSGDGSGSLAVVHGARRRRFRDRMVAFYRNSTALVGSGTTQARESVGQALMRIADLGVPGAEFFRALALRVLPIPDITHLLMPIADGDAAGPRVYRRDDKGQRVEETFSDPRSLASGEPVQAIDTTSEAANTALFMSLVDARPHLEAGLYHNPVTGEYVVFQGQTGTVSVRGADGQLTAGVSMSHDQEWKSILTDRTRGHWVLAAHSHPSRGTTPANRFNDRVPSGSVRASDGGFEGDLAVVHHESTQMVREGTPAHQAHRNSYIVSKEGSEYVYTYFGYDPTSLAGKFWIDFADPLSGGRSFHRFDSIDDYQTWYMGEVTRRFGLGIAPASPGATGMLSRSSPETPDSDGRVAPPLPGGDAGSTPTPSASPDPQRAGQAAEGDAEPARRRRLGDSSNEASEQGATQDRGAPQSDPVDETIQLAEQRHAEALDRRAELVPIIDAVRTRRGDADADRLHEMSLLGGEPMDRYILAESDRVETTHLAEIEARLARPLDGLTHDRDAIIDAMVRRAQRGDPGADAPDLHRRAEADLDRWGTQGMTRDEIDAFLSDLADLRHRRADYNYGFRTATKHRQRDEERAVHNALLFPDDPALSPLSIHGSNIDRVGELSAILRTENADALRYFAYTTYAGGRYGTGAREWDLVILWHRYLDKIGARNGGTATPDKAGFESYLRFYQISTQVARASELEAAFSLGAQRPEGQNGNPFLAEQGLLVLKGATDVDPITGRSSNEPNQPGSDFLGIDPGDGRIVYVDDKAWSVTRRNNGEIGRVSALTRNLITNMEADALALAGQEAGDPVLGDVANRLMRASMDLRDAFGEKIDLTIDGNPERFATILREHRIEMGVTNGLERGANRVSDRLKRAGFRFLRPTRPGRPPPPRPPNGNR